MKKKLLLTGALACMLVAVAVCGCKEENSTDNSVESNVSVESIVKDSSMESVTSETPSVSEKPETSETPSVSEKPETSEEASSESTSEPAHAHTYTLIAEKTGTCNEKGTIAHYLCEECGKKFDLLENEIDSVEGDYNYTNHAGEALLTATTQPTQLTYKVGEAFNPTGMVVAYKCEHCDGEAVDNQFLTYAYQTEAGVFATGDTKITVNYNGLSFDVAVTVSKAQVEISGVEALYETTCLTAPDIKATANVLDAELVVKYYNAMEEEVTEESFVAGETYTVKVSVAETDAYTGAEVTASVTVQHGHVWVSDENQWQKLTYQCACGDKKDYDAMDYQSAYVDEDDLGVDLSQFIVGAENVAVKSVQQIVRMKGGYYAEAKDGEAVEIAFSCDDKMVYTFSSDLYEKPSGEWKPYILTLLVVYDVDGVECPLVVEAKLVDKLIKTADDLKELAYMGADTTDAGGTANTKYYVLAGDIDAKDLVLPESKLAWQEAIGFCGVLEGNGHTISNLKVAAWTYGLFGALGVGSKIQNVNFENVEMGEGACFFALVARRTIFTNVQIVFNVNTKSYLLADTANANVFTNVSILAEANAVPFFKVDDANMEAIPQGITMNAFATATVSFNTNGGNDMAAVEVVIGKKMNRPEDPVKTSEEYDYEFLGWYFKGEQWDFNTVVFASMTLTAEWKETEKLNEEELVVTAIAAINALPENVTMPQDIHLVAAISAAKTAVDILSEEGKAQVTNMDKLNKLLAASKGYSVVYTPNETGVQAIPGCVPCKPMDIAATGALSTDEMQGRIFTATSGVGGNVAIQFVNFPDVSTYTTIYFYVRSTSEGYLYIANNTQNGGWGTEDKNNFNSIAGNYGKNNVIKDSWSLIAFDTATGYFTSEWFIGIWSNATDFNLEIGAIVGYSSADFKEINLEWGVRVDSGETNEYGKVYNISREQYYIDGKDTKAIGTLQQNELANALPEGYEYFVFWMYNPTESDKTFHLAGDTSSGWTDSETYITLKAGEWTKIVISAEDIQLNTEGQWYVYIGKSDVEGWKISTIYAAKIV